MVTISRNKPVRQPGAVAVPATNARKTKALFLVVSLVILTGLAGIPAACGASGGVSSETTPTSLDSTTTAGEATAAGTETITTSTELVSQPTGSSPGNLLMHDANAIGIRIAEVSGEGPGPVELRLKALVAPGQGSAAYGAMADKLLSIAGKYKQAFYFDRLRVLLVSSSGGEVLYEHTFRVTPPSSTSSTAKQFVSYYSAPSLDVSPRPGVILKVSLSKYPSGAILATVEIRNDSGSAFRFSGTDLQLYVDDALAKQAYPQENPLEVAGGIVTAVSFHPSEFDPDAAGLLYRSSDPQSQGFTASDGAIPAQSSD